MSSATQAGCTSMSNQQQEGGTLVNRSSKRLLRHSSGEPSGKSMLMKKFKLMAIDRAGKTIALKKEIKVSESKIQFPIKTTKLMLSHLLSETAQQLRAVKIAKPTTN